MKEQVNDLSGVQVGDKLYSTLCGFGEVIDIYKKHGVPVRVKFEGPISNFTLEGKYHSEDCEPTLFWDKPEFEYPKKPKTVTISEYRLNGLRKDFEENLDLHGIGYAWSKLRAGLGF